MTRAERDRRAYHRLVRKGQCVRCAQLARPGRILCARHAEQMAAYQRDRYRAMRDAWAGRTDLETDRGQAEA